MIDRPDPPTGLRRRLYRAPIYLYRLHLGSVFGGRLLLLEHVGRVSGKRREVVLEVVNHDDTAGGYVVAAGFGPKTDWYRNLLAHPNARITTKGRTVAVRGHRLSAYEGAEFMAHYGSAHPKVGVRLCKTMGFEVDGSARDFRAAGTKISFVRLSEQVTPTS